MANGLGVSYQPGAGNGTGPDGAPSGARRLSPQESVKILSLRVPERANPTAPINRSLLTSPGSAAPGASALNSLIAQLQQAFQARPPIANAPMVPAPMPSPRPSPGRTEVPNAIPTPVDTGVIGPGVRGAAHAIGRRADVAHRTAGSAARAHRAAGSESHPRRGDAPRDRHGASTLAV
jgi:hypothetical protein